MMIDGEKYLDVKTEWHVYGHTALYVGQTVKVVEEDEEEITVEFEDHRNELRTATIPSFVVYAE